LIYNKIYEEKQQQQTKAKNRHGPGNNILSALNTHKR